MSFDKHSHVTNNAIKVIEYVHYLLNFLLFLTDPPLPPSPVTDPRAVLIVLTFSKQNLSVCSLLNLASLLTTMF